MRILIFDQTRHFMTGRTLLRAGKSRGHEVAIVRYRDLEISGVNGKLAIRRMPEGDDIASFDAFIYRNAQKYASLLRILADYGETHGVFVLNGRATRSSFDRDKLSQHYRMASAGFPVVPWAYYLATRPRKIARTFGLPLIMKGIHGSHGLQVHRIDRVSQILYPLQLSEVQEFLFERYIPITFDYRVVVVGDKVLGAIRRIAKPGEFRTNVARGASVELAEVKPTLAQMARDIVKLFKLDYAGIDVIEKNGRYFILEVNYFAQFQGFVKATEVNVAEMVVRLIEEEVMKRAEKQVRASPLAVTVA
ncbi:MAG: hypothetical protein HY459_03265 [Parcubacteria group bacterium]|nr:hypothetical protein [Parcubacteria group bacterium]